MPRPRKIIPKTQYCIRLPEDLMLRVYSDLFSSVEGCVPYGEMSKFVEECIREHYHRIDQACTQVNALPAESGGATGGDEPPGSVDVGCEAHNVQNCPWCKESIP